MELLIYVANTLYLVAYAVRDILHLRMLTIVAACCLSVYFYNQVQPMMTVVYWNVFFVALNVIQLGRIYRERMVTVKDESSDVERMTPLALGAMLGGALTVHVLINQGLKAATNGPATRRKVFATER
jgi:hypothetical protein